MVFLMKNYRGQKKTHLFIKISLRSILSTILTTISLITYPKSINVLNLLNHLKIVF